jgi:phosphatidyl-myo-inositol dimannoside synthase
MRYLLVTPQFGYDEQGMVMPGGLLQFGRCLARALASSRGLRSLDVWCQVDAPYMQPQIRALVQAYAHRDLELRVRAFGGRRLALIGAMAEACFRRRFDRVMYTLVNQAVLSGLPRHPPFDLWQIGTEFFRRLDRAKRRVVRDAGRVFSISSHTTRMAARHTPGLREAAVVHLCAEPPLEPALQDRDEILRVPYRCAERQPAILIVGNIHKGQMYKGHQQLIAAWPRVVSVCPEAQLWIVGQGGGAPLLREQVTRLPASISRRIHFFGAVNASELAWRYQTARVFAMPSTGEGFGLVFVEAARHGLPCIGGRYDSAREIILHNRTGLLCEQHPHDIALACIRLLTDSACAERLSEAARLRYSNHFRFVHFRERLLSAMELAG